jgi:hypothetical protein
MPLAEQTYHHPKEAIQEVPGQYIRRLPELGRSSMDRDRKPIRSYRFDLRSAKSL